MTQDKQGAVQAEHVPDVVRNVFDIQSIQKLVLLQAKQLVGHCKHVPPVV